jgi:hypothetical protein
VSPVLNRPFFCGNEEDQGASKRDQKGMDNYTEIGRIMMTREVL